MRPTFVWVMLVATVMPALNAQMVARDGIVSLLNASGLRWNETAKKPWRLRESGLASRELDVRILPRTFGALQTERVKVRPPGSEYQLGLLGQRVRQGALPRQRDPQLTPDQLLVTWMDAQGRVLDFYLMPDPLLVRAEFPDANGLLRGETFYRAATDINISIPDDPAIRTIRVYYPRWRDGKFTLELTGEARVR